MFCRVSTGDITWNASASTVLVWNCSLHEKIFGDLLREVVSILPQLLSCLHPQSLTESHAVYYFIFFCCFPVVLANHNSAAAQARSQTRRRSDLEALSGTSTTDKHWRHLGQKLCCIEHCSWLHLLKFSVVSPSLKNTPSNSSFLIHFIVSTSARY